MGAGGRSFIIAAIALAIVTVSGMPAQAGSTTTSKPPCSRPVVIGVRGSGETARDADGFGKTVQQAVEGFKRRWDGPVGSIALDYRASPVQHLPVFGNANYRESVEDGITQLTRVLSNRGTRHCPVVLIGYSQGALVINRTLVALAALNNPALDDIAAVELIADPQRLAGATFNLGDASPLRNGLAVATGYYPPDDLPAVLHARTDSFCGRRDVVCAPDPTLVTRLLSPNPKIAAGALSQFRDDLKTHTSYVNGPTPAQAGNRAAKRTKTHVNSRPDSSTLACQRTGPELFALGDAGLVEAMQCLLQAAAYHDRVAAARVASPTAITQLFDEIQPGDPRTASVECYSLATGFCALRFSEGDCATAYYTLGRMDQSFLLIEEVTIGCDAGH